MVNSTFNPNPRVKLVGLMKTGMDNVVWYNFKKHNDKAKDKIIDGMKRRFLEKPELARNCQVLQFYDCVTGNLIEEHK